MNGVQINAKSGSKRKSLRQCRYTLKLPETSVNFKEVENYFRSSLGSEEFLYSIHSIEIILNPKLWLTYCAYLDGITNRTMIAPYGTLIHPKAYASRRLFHGTRRASVNSIIFNGFNRSFPTRFSSKYGRGTYFATSASKSCQSEFASPDIHGQQCVFLCRVAVGEYCQGSRNTNQSSIPPAKPPPISDELYDSTVDCIENPSIFVTYHDAQVYPEYLISFSKSSHFLYTLE